MVLDYEKKGKIAVFTINRPEARNAVNVQLIQELHKALLDFRDDNDLWVGILTGAGDKSFCAGADIKEFLPYLHEIADRPWALPPILGSLELWKPMIAAMNGSAFGGGLEIAMKCDIRIAAQNVRLGQTEVLVGTIPGDGGTQRLPRLIPFGIAVEMVLTGKAIDANEAYRLGLVNAVVPLDQLMPTALKVAEAICQASPIAVRAAKQAIYKGINMTLEQGLQLERNLETIIQKSEDFGEGIKAFTEKRKPIWKGK